jgi:hypothetical protein
MQLRAEYVSVMSRVLAGHFKTYLSALERMVQPVAGQADVLGLAEAPGGAMGSVASGVGGMMSLFTKAAAGRGANTVRGMVELGAAVLHGVVLQAAAFCAPAREVIARLGLLQAGLLFLVQAFLAVGACWLRLQNSSILHSCVALRNIVQR